MTFLRRGGLALQNNQLSAAITACAASSPPRHREARQLLHRWTSSSAGPGRVTADVVTFSTVLYACERAADWVGAMEVVDLMRQQGVPLNSFSYTALLSACEKGT